MKVLFVCNQNQNRSKTAADVFRGRFETKSAGIYNENPVSEKELSWSDIVVVMEDSQRSKIAQRFPKLYMQKKILSLDIPDEYYYNQPELVGILNAKMKGLF